MLQYLETLEKLEEVLSTSENSLTTCVLHPNAIVKFPNRIEYETNNVDAFMIDDGGYRYIDYPIKNNSMIDIIQNISTFGVDRFELLFNGKKIGFVPKKILISCLMYVEIKVRLFFTREQELPKKFGFYFDAGIISNVELRNRLTRYYFSYHGLKYGDGMYGIDVE